jgi:pyruvate,water dikinase
MDSGHFAKPIFGILEEVMPPAFDQGMRQGMADYGMLLETIAVRVVNGFPYTQPRAVGAPVGGKPPPPWLFSLIFRAMTRLHPELRRRLNRQRDLFERRPWLQAVRDWDARLKRESIARHATLDRVELTALPDAELVSHVQRCRDHAIDMLAQDHRLNAAFMLPSGDFLARAAQWSGARTTELMQLLRGYSDISTGDSEERRAVIAALQRDAAARAVLDGSDAPLAIYRRLLQWDGEVGAAMRAMRVVWGNAICHGITLLSPTVDEEPSGLLGALRACLRQGSARPRQTVDPAAIRARVPEEHRAEFDVMLDDAKLTCRLRDERHLYGALPTLGFGRRALQEVGRRLHARGVVPDPEVALVARCADIAALFQRPDQALVVELVERLRLARTLDASDAPETLGAPPSAPPPAEWLPNEGARRAMRAIDAYLGAMNAAGHASKEQSGVEGLAVSAGVYEGTARLCFSSADLVRVREGDVLVASVTTPAINVVLPMLGAIVTDRGGALSHAAIVCREFGIPGVVGTRLATQAIREGARVRVDGNRGVVSVLS